MVLLIVGTLLLVMVVTSSNGQQVAANCQFPFIYKHKSYSDCTREGDPKEQRWCSTSTDDQKNHIKGKWKHCTSDNGPSFCKFPFINKGVTYSACTTDTDPDDMLWCSTNTDNLNNHIKGHWRHCRFDNTGQWLTISSENECGRSFRDNVVFGEATEKGDWPWLAALGIKDGLLGPGFRPICGGTLITKQHVITAAHCIKDVSYQDITVRLGEYDVNKEGDGSQDFNVVDLRVADYNQVTKKNDLLLFKLNRPLSFFTDDIRAACLPYHLQNNNFEGNKLIVVGWGAYNARRTLAERARCQNLFRRGGGCTVTRRSDTRPARDVGPKQQAPGRPGTEGLKGQKSDGLDY
ncbi:unnamed protein product, partial [Meganyctiphanes norvegica]